MTWKPAHEAHAIERVALSFGFREAVPQKVWQTSANDATKVLADRGFQARDVMELSVTASSAGPANPPNVIPTVAGRSFQLIDNNETVEEVLIGRQAYVYGTTRYSRWRIFIATARELLSRYLDNAMAVIDVSMIKLEYWDRFYYDGDPDSADYSELLRQGSDYVPGFSTKQRSLMHAHMGHFVPVTRGFQRLININLDAVDLPVGSTGGRRRSLGVYTLAQDTLLPDNSPSDAAAVFSHADAVHAILKGLLAATIDERLAERIALNAG
jgi:uncharacterized protein (TIGR04255 family)